MKRFLRNGAVFLNLPQGDILSAGFIIMFLSLISGIFGLVRSRLLASQFTSDLNGIYFAAFVIPDNILQILILSALASAFIPVFSQYERKGKQWELTNSVIPASLILFLCIIIFCMIFTQPLSVLLVPGLQKENPQHLALLVNLTRIILFAQIFFVISYLWTGILQSYHRFVIPASASVFYNLGIIFGLLVLTPRIGMYGVAIGVVVGAFLHFLIQLPFILRLGFTFRFTKDIFSGGVREIITLMLPRAASVAIERSQFTVETILSSLISLSSITYLNFATQIATFPVSLVGSAIAQAALPFFAKATANGDSEGFKKHLNLSLTHIIFLLTPASVLIIALHTPIVRLIFGAPRFDWESTILTGRTLAILSAALVAEGANNILAKAFYALHDTKTPLLMTIISIITSICLSMFFILGLKLDVRFLALSATVGAYINAIALLILLSRKVHGLLTEIFWIKLGKIIIIAVFLYLFTYEASTILEGYINTNYTLQLTIFTIFIGIIGGTFYLFLSYLFNIDELSELISLFQKAKSVRHKFMKEVFEIEEK